MEDDKNKGKMNERFYIDYDVESLSYFTPLLEASNNIEILNDLEIEPFQKFNLKFSEIYWYFKYSLLKYKKIFLDKEEIFEEYKSFFDETNLNFIYIDIIDKNNYEIKCINGRFYIEIFDAKLLELVHSKFSFYKLD